MEIVAKPIGQGRFAVMLDGHELGRTRQPLYEGARMLLAAGHDPEAMLTMRLDGSAFPSFKPMSIAALAKWTIEETDESGLKRRRWVPLDRSVFGVRKT